MELAESYLVGLFGMEGCCVSEVGLLGFFYDSRFFLFLVLLYSAIWLSPGVFK
jgi:hypothetical protein